MLNAYAHHCSCRACAVSAGKSSQFLVTVLLNGYYTTSGHLIPVDINVRGINCVPNTVRCQVSGILLDQLHIS